MCVSLGTATTVDMIDGGGVHLGGYIFAGINTSLNAISNRGSQLPKTLNVDIDMHGSQERWPENTSEAMTWAPWCSTLATLKSERTRLAKHCGMDSEKITVVLNGGFAGLVKSIWDDGNVIHCKDLALLGAVLMAINGR
jgi:pantothenate kinase type III